MNLWLDDITPSPPGWVWVRTVKEARELLVRLRVTTLSLDFDLFLTDPLHTGADVLDWLLAHPEIRRPVIQFHTSNPVGAANLAFRKRLIEQQARQIRRRSAGEP